jgi:hypothetical protein
MQSPDKVKLPVVPDKGPTYSPDSSSPIYDKSKLPPGFEKIRLSAPSGYISPKRIPPEIEAKASSLLGKRVSGNLPFNYTETHTVMEDGKPVEYLLLINMHFDNHPKMGKDPSHPPYWHPGISVFQKDPSKSTKKDTELKEELELKDEKEDELLEFTKNLESIKKSKAILDLVIKFSNKIESLTKK